MIAIVDRATGQVRAYVPSEVAAAWCIKGHEDRYRIERKP
jgi:hypothetical protein